VDRDDLGFLLAKATQRWNELLQERFRAAGWGEVQASYGSILCRCSKRTACGWESSPAAHG
jgi:hypothetical protein